MITVDDDGRPPTTDDIIIIIKRVKFTELYGVLNLSGKLSSPKQKKISYYLITSIITGAWSKLAKRHR